MRILPFPSLRAVSSDEPLPTTAEAVNFSMDAFGRVVSVDSVWIAIVGLTLADFAAGLWIDRIHPEDSGPVMRRFFKALGEGRPFSVSSRFRIATGRHINVSLQITPFLDLKGTLLHWRGVLTYDPAELDSLSRTGSEAS